MFAAVYLPFLASAFAFTLGNSFRQPVIRNYSFSLCISFFFAVASALLLLPQGILTETFRIAPQQFNSPCPASCYANLTATITSSDEISYVGVCASCPTNPVWLVYQQPLPYGLGGEASPAMDEIVCMMGWPSSSEIWFHSSTKRAASSSRACLAMAS